MSLQVQWREWNLTGLEISQLHFDSRVTFNLWFQERKLVLVFGCPFTFRTAEGVVWECHGEKSETLCPLLPLCFRPASIFRASSEGNCELIFEDGGRLSCSPDENYEAWESHGSGDLATACLLCGPGGGSPWG